MGMTIQRPPGIPPYDPALTGSVVTTVPEKLRESVSVFDFMTAAQKADVKARTALIDVAAPINAAITDALTGKLSVFMPAGLYLVGSTITGGSGLDLYGAGSRATRIRPAITDGSPIIYFPNPSLWFTVADIGIEGTITTAAFNAGGSALNCIGLRAGLLGTGFATRMMLRNIFVHGVKTAYDIYGFIITGDNLWANACELAFKGEQINAVDLNLRLENNRKDFEIINSWGVYLRQLMAEGGNTLAVASTIDNVHGIVLDAPYFEHIDRPVPFLHLGGTAEVTQFRMTGALVGGCASGVSPILLDRVDGADVEGFFIDNKLRKLETTANTKNLRLQNVTADSDTWWHDESKQLSSALNYWPNRQFDMWFRGWNAVTLVNATFTRETSIVRKGENAVRITCTAAQTFNYVEWRLTGDAVTALRGKTIRAGAWVFLPDIAAYDETNRILFPSIRVSSFNGSVFVNSPTKNNVSIKGKWNFFWAEVVVQSDATLINFRVYANESGTAAGGTEYVVVDSITLVESSVPFARQLNDDLVDSPMIGAIGVGGRMVASGTAIPGDPDQTYAVGDIVWNTGVAAGGSPGWVCTTAGSPGTWKAMAAVAP